MRPLGLAILKTTRLSKNNLHEPIGISHLKDDPAPLDATNGEDEEGEVVKEGVRLSTLVHPQSIIHVKSLLLLLDQLVLGRNVLTERVFANVPAQVLSSCSSCCGECPACHKAALSSK